MKKILALVTMTFGVLLGVGAGTASAYPPPTTPTITGGQTVAPGASVTIEVSNAAVGTTVTLSFNGATQTATVAAGGAAFSPLAAGETGSASFTVTAPATAGTYPATAVLSTGETLTTNVIVKAGGNNGNNGNNGNKGNTGNKTGSALPSTGSDLIGPAAGIALAAIVGGLGLLFVSKRRRVTA